MSGGEHSRDGSSHIDLFDKLVTRFGWIRRGPLDKNATCSVCTTKEGKETGHGVDGLYEFRCPSTGNIRGAVVDAKRWATSSVGGPGKLNGFLRDTTRTAEHLRRSVDLLVRDRGVDARIVVDTAIVAWDAHDERDDAKARKWRTDMASAGRLPQGGLTAPLWGFVMLNDELDRLQAIANFARDQKEIEFFHHAVQSDFGAVPAFSRVLTPEIVHSSMVLCRHRDERDAESRWCYAMLYFDDDGDAFAMRHLLHYLASYGQFALERVTVHAACRHNRLDALRTSIQATVASLKEEGARIAVPKVDVEMLTITPYLS